MTAIAHSISSGYAAYRKQMHASSPTTGSDPARHSWDSLDNRLNRYRFLWALYENDAYDNLSYHGAPQFKTQWAISKNTRGCYNPWFRLGNFWAQHVWIGGLDSSATHGRVADSACPIETRKEAIREPIARLWRDSNWEVNKEMIPRMGAVLGDFAARVEDDTQARKVRIIPVNPASVAWLKRDYQGNVDAYQIREWLADPRATADASSPVAGKLVEYVETVVRDGDTVRFETLLDGEPYAWNGISGRWEVDYGFVPLVVSPHLRALPELCFGWSEFHGGIVKGVEADHVGSNLHDQIRKASDPRFWVSGTQPPASGGNRVPNTAPSAANPQPGAQELPFFYGGSGSSASALVFPLDIQFTSMEIAQQLDSLEKDYAELRYESRRAAGDASAKALRETRKACEAKVHSRRAVYDNALVRLHMMALSIGGMRGYKGYEAFPPGSYADGELDHTIGPRTVFLLDPLDRADELKAYLENWQIAKNADVPAEFYLRMTDATEEQIALFHEIQDAEASRSLSQQTALIGAQAAATPTPKAPTPAP